MTRDVTSDSDYYISNQSKKETAMPIRWMAPESVIDKKFSEDTDIWSYGIVLWEIVTYGEVPFGKFSNETVDFMVRDGYTPNLPENCADDFKNLMNLCWRKDPKKEKIKFKDVVKMLLSSITHLQKFEKVSFYHKMYD